MKAAAAVLGASLLFFLGVLTGAGRKESRPPPTAIPLGVATPETPASGRDGGAPATRPPAAPGTSRTTARNPSSGGATPTTASTVSTATTLPPGSANDPARPGEPTSETRPTATTPPTAPASTTSTSVASSPGSGEVEQVDGQVDCGPAGGRGKGKREPCPPTTPERNGPGGRSGR